MTARQKAWLVFLVIMKRVRFILILLAVGMFIGYWDTIKNYWDKYTRPRAVAARRLAPDQEFFCPMHPQVVQSDYEPNGEVPKCPICGMPLSVRKKGETLPLPEGITGRVQLSPERIQMAGIQTVAVGYRPLTRQTTTVGYVTFDESRLSRVTSRVSGYVEKLYIDQTFSTVRQKDPLAEIYSPELYSAAQELLLASQRQDLADLAAGARMKLSLLGVGEQEIHAILASGQASPRLVIRSPQSGYVMAKNVVAGSRVETGMTLLEVADLSAVWVEAEIYEKDIAFLQPGQKVKASVEAFPNRVFTGTLALIYPEVDPATRTNRVRFALENPQHELRPGMFATVTINTPLEAVEPFKTLAAPRVEFLVVPERAVVDSGTKKVVYVERAPGLFEGVEVQLGPPVGDYYPVIQGLDPGDRVAAAGSFLIDAETRLNPAAASTYFGASGGPRSGSGTVAPAPTGEPRSETSQPGAEKATFTAPTAEDLKNVALLPEGDRQQAIAQRNCPITGYALGSMGVPRKITLAGQTVFLCCPGCVAKAKRAPEGTLQRIADFKNHGPTVKP
jgi:multidrug efflux pump subunit AcrA (membrane-fusion protein)